MNNIECTDLDQHPRQQNIISESRTTHRTTKRTSEQREWEGWRLVVATPIGRRPGVINSRPDLPQSHTINPLSVSRRTFTHTQKQASTHQFSADGEDLSSCCLGLLAAASETLARLKGRRWTRTLFKVRRLGRERFVSLPPPSMGRMFNMAGDGGVRAPFRFNCRG